MIYGQNFNRTDIPAEYRRKFADRKRIYICPDCQAKSLGQKRLECAHHAMCIPYRPKGESGMARLQGVATSFSEARQMCIQADNGHRFVYAVRRSDTLFGIYCY